MAIKVYLEWVDKIERVPREFVICMKNKKHRLVSRKGPWERYSLPNIIRHILFKCSNVRQWCEHVACPQSCQSLSKIAVWGERRIKIAKARVDNCTQSCQYLSKIAIRREVRIKITKVRVHNCK